MLSTQGLRFQYNKDVQFSFPDFNLEAGSTLLILGNSGAGKTTLLHILAGLLKPSAGSVVVDQQSIYDLSSSKLDAFRGTNISVVFQKPHFVRSIPAKDNLVLAQKFSKNKVDPKFATEVLQKLQIDHRANSFTYEMSEGEQQRLSIARAIINKPKVILADEPTSALDDSNCDAVLSLLQQQSREANAALVVVTHDQRLKDKIENRITI